MKYFTLFLLVLLAACSEDEPNCEEVQPEPFRFKLIDQAGNNRLTDDERPSNIRIYYLRNATEVSLELNFEGRNEEMYGVSPVVPYISIFENIETYYLERDSTIDTLLVRASQRNPGNQCEGFSYDEVAFNGVAAAYDSTAEPPVYVLIE